MHAAGNPLADQHVKRPEGQDDQRVPVEAVAQPAPPPAREILVDGNRRDVAVAAPIEIARRRVVDRVLVAPLPVRGAREHTRDPSHHVVPLLRREERPVAAVVHDDERADQEAGRGHREREGEPVRPRQGQVHHVEQPGQRHERVDQLEHRSADVRPLVRRHDGAPVSRIELHDPMIAPMEPREPRKARAGPLTAGTSRCREAAAGGPRGSSPTTGPLAEPWAKA